MVISFKLEITGKPLNKAIKTKANQIVQRVAEKATQEARKPILDIIANEPRKRQYPDDYPLPFTSNNQRMAFFASNGFGGGIPYRRSGNLALRWFVDYVNGEVVIVNKAKYAKYVYGTFRKLKPRQRFHQITGWPAARLERQNIIDTYVNIFIRELKRVTK